MNSYTNIKVTNCYEKTYFNLSNMLVATRSFCMNLHNVIHIEHQWGESGSYKNVQEDCTNSYIIH